MQIDLTYPPTCTYVIGGILLIGESRLDFKRLWPAPPSLSLYAAGEKRP